MTWDAWEGIIFCSTKEILKTSLENVFGGIQDARNAQKEYGAEGQDLESFRLSIFEHDKGGKLQLREEKIPEPIVETVILGPTKSNYNNPPPIPTSISGATSSTIGTRAETGEPILVYTEKDLASMDLPDSIKNEVRSIESTINTTLEICKLLATKSYMTNREYKHWMQWALDV